MKLSVCIEMVLNDAKFIERIGRITEAGYEYFEFWGWPGKDIEGIKAESAKYGVSPSVFGVNGTAIVDPANQNSYLAGLKESIDVARQLGVTTLLTTTGNEIEGVSRQAQHDSVVTILRAAAPVAADAGITLVLEPLNILVDHKGYYLFTSEEGFAIIDEVGSPNVKLLFDIYHQQITEGNIIRNIVNNIDKIGHFHVADNPGRNEPGTGELNYKAIFDAIKGTSYNGFVGLEYHPTVDPIETLRAIKALAD